MVIIPTLIVLIDNLKDSSINSTVNIYTRIVSIVTLIASIITLISSIATLIVSLPVLIINMINIIGSLIILIISVFIGKSVKKLKKHRKKAIVICKVFLLISMIILICSAVILFGNENALSEEIATSGDKETLSKTIVTLIGIIVAFLSGMYTTMKSNKATLSSESLWREELMNVASKDKIGKDDLLRLRASQRYSYTKKKTAHVQKNDSDTKEEPNNKNSGNDSKTDVEFNNKNCGDEVRNKIGHITNELYIRCILNGKEIEKKDVNTIRNLAIALLKYDYIKRGDNVKLTHYIIRELEEDYEYRNLLEWINEEIDINAHRKK